jgi:hypothetical protein
MVQYLAPNGKPSNLNPEQYKLVRTKAFKDWFGDWENDPANASKVVDENGEPLVCNHSSRDKNIDIFYGGRIFRTKNNEVKPIWFNYKSGFVYATGEDIFHYECFLNIRKMFDYSNEDDVFQLSKYFQKINQKELPDYDFNMDWEEQENFNLPAYIYEMGYDGYKFTDEYSIVVFNANQIKLADGTNTTFDGNNPDIRYAGGGDVNVVDIKQYNIGDRNYRFVEIAEKNFNKIELYRQADDGKYYGHLLYRRVPRYTATFSSPMVNDINQLYAFVPVSDDELFNAVKNKTKPFASIGFWISYYEENELKEQIQKYISECDKYNLEYSVKQRSYGKGSEIVIFEVCQKGTFDELFDMDALIEDYEKSDVEYYFIDRLEGLRNVKLSEYLEINWDNGYSSTGLILGIPPKFTMSIINMGHTYDLSKEYKYNQKVTIIENKNNPDIRFDSGGAVQKNKKRILSSLSNYESYDEWKRENKSDYIYSQKNNLLKEVKEHYGLEHKVSSKYTFDDVLNDAKKYKTYSDWSTTSRAIYDFSRKRGWLPEIKKELNYIPQERKHTLESIIESAKRFGSYQEWRINSPTEYQIAKINGWFDEIKNAIGYVKTDLSNTRVGKGKLTLESIIESTNNYDSYTEWRIKNEAKYKRAIAEGWLDKIKELFQYEKRGRKDTLESIIEKVKEYPSYTEWMKDDILTYQLATKRGWLTDIKNAIGYKYQGKESKYTLQSVIENAKKYDSYLEWRENNKNEYQIAREKGWLNEIKNAIGYVRHRHQNIESKYNLESVIENVKKYPSLKEWRENNKSQYVIAQRKGWLPEIKNAIGYKLKEKTKKPLDLIIEKALSHKYYAEWIENNPNDFIKAHEKGWLNDIKNAFLSQNRFDGGGAIQPRDLTQIENYRNIYKGAEFYTFSDNPEKVEKADRWFELFRTNQKERQLTAEEFVEFMQLSNELSWEEFSNGGGVEWDAERYRQVEREMYELRQQEKADTPEYFKLIKERGILEKSKLKKTQNKDIETGHSDINTTYAKGGKIVSYKTESAKFKRIGIEDKYIIEAINEIGLQGINFDEQTILKKIDSEFEELLDSYQSYLISEDSQSITNYMKNEIETKREEGASLEVIDKMEKAIGNIEERQKTINDIAKTQLEVISIWIDYLKSSEYRIAFKYLILKAVLNYNYDLKQNKLIQRKNYITIRNFTPFDAGTLAELHEMESDYLLEDYSKIMNENSQKVLNSRDVIEESGDGKWLKFNGGIKTNEKERDNNAKELMQLVQNTYWCTKTNANGQLRGGDFYVYVTEKQGEIFPRIAVRMNENEVGEVRGNRSSAQDLEDDMLPIAEDFLIKNIPNNSGRKWLNSIRYNKRCSDLIKRMESEGLFKDFIYEYIELVADASKYNVDYGGNGNVALLKEVFNQKLNSLPNGYYKQGDIVTERSKLGKETLYYIGNLDPYDISKLSLDYGVNMDLNTWKLKLISGNFQPSPSITTLGNLEMIGGNFTCNEELNDLGSLKYIGGFINFSTNNKITSLENIEYIGNTLIIDNSKQNIKNLGKLKKINGSLNLINCDETFDVGDLEYITENLTLTQSNIDFKNIKKIDGSLNLKGSLVNDLKMLEYVGGSLDISNSKVKIFQNLKFIGGDVDFSNNFSSSTQSIETILGSVKFLNSRIVEFPNLKKIGGDIDFRGSFFKTFGNIKYIGGNINLAESKVEELGNLEYVGGYVNFRGTKIESLNKLKKIVSFVNFEGSNVSDLGDLESIGGNAYFIKTKIKSLGKLKYIGGIAQFDRDTTLEKEWNKRKNG